MIKIEYTITGWTHNPYTDTIEVADADLDGLEAGERARVIDDIVDDAVFNVVSWGWREVKPEGVRQ